MKVTMKLEDLKTIFNACKTFVSKDDVKPILKTVHLSFSNGYCTAYALDGIKLISLVVPCQNDSEGTMNVPIIKLPKAVFVVISDEGNEIVFDFLDSKQTVKKYEGDFPSKPEDFFRNDNEPTFSIGFDPKNLKDALDGFKDDKTVEIAFYGQTKACVIKSLTKKALVFPVRLKRQY